MKAYRALFVVFVLAAMLLSACAASASPSNETKVEPAIIVATAQPATAVIVATAQPATAVMVATLIADTTVTGVIESMQGTRWVVNGRTLKVEPAMLRDVAYQVGALVKVQGNLQADGSILVSSIAAPGPDDLATATALANDNGNDNGNDNANDNNANDNGGGSGNDNGGGGNGGGSGNDNGGGGNGGGGGNDNGGGDNGGGGGNDG